MTDRIIHLKAGQRFISSKGEVVHSALGSCVAVCLLAPSLSIGAMVIFSFNSEFDAKGKLDSRLYAQYALDQLITELQVRFHIQPNQLKAKVVGGANRRLKGALSISDPQLGSTNVNAAKQILNRLSIPIVGEDTGQESGRKLIFTPQTGRLQVAFTDEPVEWPSLPGNRSEVSPGGSVRIYGSELRSTPSCVRVLIVDDSKTIRDLLSRILKEDSRFEVVGQAEDAVQAEALLLSAKPDLITLDVHMPKMTGVEWLRTLLPRKKIPVVMITSLEFKNGNEVFEAMEIGAVDYLQKPTMDELASMAPVIREKLVAASMAKVRIGGVATGRSKKAISAGAINSNILVAIGSSTGGTEALREIFMGFPDQIPPVVVVQHIPPIFSRAFAERMNQLCSFEVKEAEHGDLIQSNRILIAPGGRQMKVVRQSRGLVVEINNDPPMERHKPSVDYLFYSVAEAVGKKAIGLILTGMGGDGAQGLLKMKASGAITLSQDEPSCVVYGMPKVAWELGASQKQLPLELISSALVDLWTLEKTKIAS